MDDEAIPTSDPEELEELRAEEDLEGYWADVLPTIISNLAMMKARNELGIGCITPPTGSTESRMVKSDDGRRSNRPGKRAKLSHSASNENIGSGSPEPSFDTSRNSRRVARDRSNSFMSPAINYIAHTIESKQFTHEPTVSSSGRRLVVEGGTQTLPTTPHRNEHSETPDILSVLHISEAEDILPSDDLPEIGHSTSSQSYVVPSPSSPSEDPLLLFGSQEVQPSQLSGVGSKLQKHTELSVDPEDNIPIASSSRHIPSSPPSSPLSPGPSDSPRPPPQSPTNDLPSLPSSPLSSPDDNDDTYPQPPGGSEETTNALIEELQHQENRKYAFRERNVRQLKPYAYERQMYVRQMRSNPDAIVKFRSPPRRKHAERPSSPGEGPSSDGEVNPADLDLDASDDDRQRRRANSATASEIGRAHRRARSTATPNPDAARSRARDRPPAATPPRSPATHPVVTRNTAEEWYQAKLQELNSSSSEDDLAVSLPHGPKDAVQEQHGKRRKRRFPMNLARRAKSPSARPRSRTPDSPQASSSILPETHVDSSDVEIVSNEPGPSRRRSLSADGEHEPWNLLDDLRFDERLPSPASNPPTSSSVQDPDGFDFEFEPNRWGSPSRYGSQEAEQTGEDGSDAGGSRGGSAVPRGTSPEDPIIIMDDSSDAGDKDSDEENVSDTESITIETEAELRKQYKELFCLYPRMTALRMLQKDGSLNRKKPAKSKPRKQSIVPDDGPLRPGQAKVRVGSRREINLIKGDSESSDDDARSPSRSPHFSHLPRTVSGSTSRIARRTVSRMSISLSSDSESEVDGPQDDPDSWMNEPKAWHESRRGMREGTLVDYMLNRANGTGRKKKNKTGARPTGRSAKGPKRSNIHVQIRGTSVRKPPRQQSSSIRTRVTIAGARKYGPKRQTLLNFPRFDADSEVPVASGSQEPVESGYSLDLSVGMPKNSGLSSSKPAWKKDRNRTRDRVYFLKPKLVKVTSDRARQGYTTTVVEQDAPARRPVEIMRFPQRTHLSVRKARSHAPLPVRQSILKALWHADNDDGPVEPQEMRPAKAWRKEKDSITVDMGVAKLPSGISFEENTYLATSSLHVLLLPPNFVDAPPPGYIGTTRIFSAITAPEFSIAVNEALTEIISKLGSASISVTREVFEEWQRFLPTIRQWSGSYLSSTSFEDADTFRTGLVEEARRIYTLAYDHFAVRSDDSPANLLALQLQWTAIEFLYRVGKARNHTFSPLDEGDLVRHLKLLMKHLWACNLDPHLGSLWPLGVGRLHYGRPIVLISELWICLIHFTESSGIRGSFWNLLQQAVLEFNALGLGSSKFATSEAMWSAIYSLCALSQFSSQGLTTPEVRLPDSWKFVATALQQAPLIADAAADTKIPERGLKKRDRYVKLLISRCVWLHTHWDWPLNDSEPMFRSLHMTFKSRRFADLLHEKGADFPAFLKEHKIELLSVPHEVDHAFAMFLKLAVKAATEPVAEANPRRGLSQNIMKLMSFVVPIGSVPFKKFLPTSPHESSMLYNRLSAIAVAIYLEQTASNAKSRITQARRYVDFKETDQGTRQACIRGAMYLMILLQHVNLPLVDALDWLAEMTNCLVDEFLAVHRDDAKRRQKNDAVKAIQMILACTRRVIETPCMDNTLETKPARYPETGLLQGPWVTRIFSSSANLSSTMNTALEMRMLVQAFLKARNAVLPRPIIRRAPPVVQEESQEDYGDFGFDLDDPAVAAALGVGDQTEDTQEIKKKEEDTCKVIDECIGKAVFRVLCAHLSSRHQDQLETDKWVECWIGCAEVLVRNGRRNWAFYFEQASQTWELMKLDALALRRISLHFTLTVLKYDPSAYSAQQDHFLKIFFTCMAIQHPELEAEYVALIFTVDGMQHTLLQGIPCPSIDGSGNYQLSRTEFVERRVSYLDHILRNLERFLSDDAGISPSITELNRRYVDYITVMLAAMQEAHKNLDLSGRALYTPFCSKVSELLCQNPVVQRHPTLGEYAAWLKSV